MKKMFKDIFFGQTLNAETVLEMHYIQRTGSVETDELGNYNKELAYSEIFNALHTFQMILMKGPGMKIPCVGD